MSPDRIEKGAKITIIGPDGPLEVVELSFTPGGSSPLSAYETFMGEQMEIIVEGLGLSKSAFLMPNPAEFERVAPGAPIDHGRKGEA